MHSPRAPVGNRLEAAATLVDPTSLGGEEPPSWRRGPAQADIRSLRGPDPRRVAEETGRRNLESVQAPTAGASMMAAPLAAAPTDGAHSNFVPGPVRECPATMRPVAAPWRRPHQQTSLQLQSQQATTNSPRRQLMFGLCSVFLSHALCVVASFASHGVPRPGHEAKRSTSLWSGPRVMQRLASDVSLG